MEIVKRICLFIMFILPISAFILSLYLLTNANTSESGTGFHEATVVRVVDGDTIIANIDGNDEKIRMIGVNTPESVSSDESKNCEEGRVASDYTKKTLAKGMIIYLEYDENLEDIYGRTLAYIWLSNSVDMTDYNDFCKYNYGAILLQNTYCESVYYAPNGKYKTWYDQLESEYQPYGSEKTTIIEQESPSSNNNNNISAITINNSKKAVENVQNNKKGIKKIKALKLSVKNRRKFAKI